MSTWAETSALTGPLNSTVIPNSFAASCAPSFAATKYGSLVNFGINPMVTAFAEEKKSKEAKITKIKFLIKFSLDLI